MKIANLLFCLVLAGCVGVPEGITPVEGFDAARYMGTWYEIARLDHPFERGLTNVTAEYSISDNSMGDNSRSDKGIKVINRGYDTQKNEWKVARGKARFVGEENVGYLKVSFFGPFYSSYVIFELDKQSYDYAFVTGRDKSYLWLLARKPYISDELRQRFLQSAKSRGFNVDELIFVEQDASLTNDRRSEEK